MCGIGGLIGAQDEGGAISRRMLAAVRRRGPDDEGLVQPTPTVSLVHTRLSIFDTSAAGHQPMTDRPAGDPSGLWVVFNGEIYNFKELEAELAARGLTFPWVDRRITPLQILAFVVLRDFSTRHKLHAA